MGASAVQAKGAKPRAVSPEQTEALEARMAAALYNSLPTTLALFPDNLGWVKRCNAEAEPVCTVSRGFSLDPTLLPTLKATITTTANAGTYPTAILVPLDQDLRSGFALRGGTGEAALGTYRRCSVLGCGGDLSLPETVYKDLLTAEHMDVVIKDINGRTVTYRAPLEGLKAAIDGSAMSDEAFATAAREAGEKLMKAAQARQAAAAARPEPAAAPTSPETATPATIDKPEAAPSEPAGDASAPADAEAAKP